MDNYEIELLKHTAQQANYATESYDIDLEVLRHELFTLSTLKRTADTST